VRCLLSPCGFPRDGARNVSTQTENLEKRIMRADMKKVVVERPRGGSRQRNNKFGARLRYIPDHDYDDQPKKARGFESYGSDGRGKWFTDVLGPLERFVRSNLGRPWDKVYSELCAGLDKRKVTGLHIFQHLDDFVERNCYLGADRKPYTTRYGNPWPVSSFYVHPRTGLLCEAPPGMGARKRRRAKLLSEDVTLLHLGNNRAYRKHDGIWYRAKLKYVFVDWRKEYAPTVWDIFLKRRVQLSYGSQWVAVEKKQCNHDELKEVQRLLQERERKIRRM
jgi:hypothetical protein